MSRVNLCYVHCVIVNLIIFQIDGTTFSYTFVAQGYDKKLSDKDEQPEDEPKKKLVTKVLGPGK